MPSIELRLATMVRALEEVILPAIAPGNDLAREQAQLLIAHLALVGKHWQRAHRYDALTLEAMRTASAALVAAADGGARTGDAAAALASCLHAVPDGTVDAAARRAALAAAVDTLVTASAIDGSAGFRAALFNIIVAHGRAQAARDRAWFADSGMDPESATLDTIDEVLEGRA